ncbi:MAG: choice-of-anchor J domain-containing protein [Muribaculaceae bacterium]|nr:choice-of-anchor J domain-containing protein [Muribaculaceae bacterium]
MKVRYPILACVMALGAAGTTMWALSRPTSEQLENRLLEQRTPRKEHPTPMAAPTAENSDGSMYWSVAKSCYGNNGLDLTNGPTRQFGTRIEIDGETATIYGLVDLYFDEVDKEYAVQGKYDDRAGTITITGTEYDSDKPTSDFIKLADMYSVTNNAPYTIMLFAGNMTGENLTTIDKLVFRVSEDLSTLTSDTGYGAYAFNTAGETMAFYDYYQPGVTMTLATPDRNLAVSTDSLDFDGLFIAAGIPIKQNFYIYNPGSEETTFEISSSSPDLTVSTSEGRIPACSSRTIEVTLNATQAGIFDGALTITSSTGNEPLTVRVNVDVWEQPDYTKITKAGSAPIEFEMSPVYPFVISEFDGHIAAMSTNNRKGDNTQSFFICKLDIPEGETGVFSWDAAQITKQPNTLTIYLDEEPIKYDYYVQTSAPVDMSGVVALSSGHHEVAFSQNISIDWAEYDTFSTGYVWNLDLQLMPTQANFAYLVNNSADFGTTYYDGLSVEMKSKVSLLNLGEEALKVTEIRGNGNFSGEIPAISVPQGGEIEVPLTWTASALGIDEGEVVIATTAGEFTVKCKGTGKELPYDYSKFVTEGKIAFNTDVAWPFKVSDNGKYLYNSTSKADIDGITESWIEAIFEVPEGKVGMISWDALNDSEDIFYFMDIPSLVSGTRFTIDGGMEEMVGGMGVNCASADIYTPEQLTFKTGRHIVRFTYKKTSNEERFVFGEDRLKLFEIALRLENLDDHKADISTTEVTYPSPVYVGCAGHYPITVIDYTSELPELLASVCDGPFVAKSLGINEGNLNLMVEFVPEKGGEYESELTISTNIGDFKLKCKGSAEESELGKALFYESFEYNFDSDWIITDANSDNNTWEKLSPYIEAFKNQDLLPYEGNDGLILMGYSPISYDYFDTDDYASTPEITIPEDGVTTLRFMVMSWSYMEQNLEILVGEGNDPAKYQVVEKLTFDIPTNWEAQQVDLSAFAGQKIRIAFRGSEIAQFIAIDDVLVASTGNSGVNTINADRKIIAEEYYSVAGERLAQPTKGVNVVVTRYSDGSHTSSKRIMK